MIKDFVATLQDKNKHNLLNLSIELIIEILKFIMINMRSHLLENA